MAEQKKTNNKARIAIRVVFGIIAVASLVTMVLISPFGKRLMGKDEATTTEDVVETIPGGVETEPFVPKTEEDTAESEVQEGTTNPTPAVSVSVPEPTQPVENPLKNYSIFINSYKFNYTEENGITTAVAKDDENVKMTVTPKGDVTYSDLCEKAKSELGSPASDRKLQLANANTCYSSEADHIKTTVFCVDDGKGGSIEIRYQYPADKDGYEDEFGFMISMFKVDK